MRKSKSQNQLILNHLTHKGSITPAEALVTYGCMRLAARIGDLKNHGHKIETEIKTDQLGGRYARYWLLKKSSRKATAVMA